jgi:hypothetical protein
MKFSSQKGFILIETLVVAVFVTIVFTMIFTNVFPILSEYQRISHYDDLDSKYAAHYARRIIISDANWNNIKNLNGALYKELTCDASVFDQFEECGDLTSSLKIDRMYLIDFKTNSIKASIPAAFDQGLADYIKYMVNITTIPTAYTTYSNNGNTRRLIIVREDETTDETFYANIEVVKPS